jgi:hypothetical protein
MRNNQQTIRKTIQNDVVKNTDSVRIQAASSGVRFASNDSVKSASHWALRKYAGAFKKLAQ